MENIKAFGERIKDESGEIVILIRPNWKWFFNMKHKIMITKDDFKGNLCDIEYY